MPQDRLLETFLDLVQVYGPPLREEAVARYVAGALRESGWEVRFDDTEAVTGSETGNLVAVLPGEAEGAEVVLSAHFDTVEPAWDVKPVVRDGVVRSSGDTILGADDRGGIACIIEAGRRLRETGEPHPPVRAVITVSEELGLVGAKAMDPADAHGDLCLVLDGEGPVGQIVVRAPTHWTFKATFTGRASHAGVAPEKGRSAVAMAALAVSAMTIGRIDDETTANIGRIEGGSATNVVAPTCALTGECRSLEASKVEDVRLQMDKAMHDAAEGMGGSVEVAWTKEYEGFHFPEDDPLMTILEKACRDIGVEPEHVTTGGGSDGNILFAKGVPTVVLSSGMRDVHSVDETISVKDMHDLVDLILAVIRHASEAKA